jgi:putative nucleotidyltransferase with HDIG domain
MNNINRRMIIQKITNLPTLPNIVMKIIELADSPQANADSLGNVLSKDQSISSLILRLVNSAFYGSFRHVNSINHATVMLGFPMVKTIAMGVAVFQNENGSAGFDRKAFWLHSLGVATASQFIADKAKFDTPKDTAFLAGLLHDLGKVVLDNYFEEEYREVIDLVREKEIWIGEAERQLLQLDHSVAGFYLARKWQFPAQVVDVIHHHHHISACPEDSKALCAAVQAADYVCRKSSVGSGGDLLVLPLENEVPGFGISDDILDAACAFMEKQKPELEAFVNS